jgi:hypothetical protein
VQASERFEQSSKELAARKGESIQEQKKREKHVRKGKRKRSTGPSRVVPHRSTTPARTCLTSLFGLEAVSQPYGRAEDVHLSGAILSGSFGALSEIRGEQHAK